MEYIISDLFGKIANAVGFGGGDKAPPKLSEGCQQMTNQVVANIVGSGDRVNLYAAVNAGGSASSRYRPSGFLYSARFGRLECQAY
jgi:hypothetical protein